MRIPAEKGLIRQKAEELKGTVERKFPTVEVEYLDWDDIMERRRRGIRVHDAYELDLFIDVYLWIRGAARTVEQALSLAHHLESKICEESGVEIEVRTGTEIWCRRSGPEPDGDWDPEVRGRLLYAQEDKRGVTFLCWAITPHKHEWGRVKPHLPIVELR